jgi:beta-fructofuranosidase
VLPEHWLWDFWFAVDGEDVHVFYLQAPRSLGDPSLRHVNATIGHAVSRDLRSWRVLPPALGTAGPAGAFDDVATWTGSVVRGPDGRWHMFYSGISAASGGREQRIGAAVSSDLVVWERRGEVLAADPRWYEASGVSEVHWRDPWVYADGAGGWGMLITARAAAGGPVATRGVVGRAWSPDLVAWEAEPPVSAPGELFQYEVPQLLFAGGRWRVLFSSMEEPGGGGGGVHFLTGDTPSGPFVMDHPEFLFGGGHWYAGRAIEHGGAWWLLAWRMHDAEGRFAGTLSDPLPLTFPPPEGV